MWMLEIITFLSDIPLQKDKSSISAAGALSLFLRRGKPGAGPWGFLSPYLLLPGLEVGRWSLGFPLPVLTAPVWLIL